MFFCMLCLLLVYLTIRILYKYFFLVKCLKNLNNEQMNLTREYMGLTFLRITSIIVQYMAIALAFIYSYNCISCYM